jgi:hypothetical protein
MFRLVRLVVTLGVLVGAWYLLVPNVASHFGWATRWPSSMPSVVKFSGRNYGSPTPCRARSKTPLRDHPGSKVGRVPVLFGSSMPVLERSPRRPVQPAEVAIIVKRHPGCFITYGLEGGP